MHNKTPVRWTWGIIEIVCGLRDSPS